MKTVVVACFALVGCAGGSSVPTDTSDPTPTGACGDASSMDVILAATVEDAAGAPLAGVEVRLEERNWDPGTIHALGETGATGAVELTAGGLPVVEGCWGTAVSYWLAAEDGALAGEKHVNRYLEDAWLAGTDRVDVPFPLVLR